MEKIHFPRKVIPEWIPRKNDSREEWIPRKDNSRKIVSVDDNIGFPTVKNSKVNRGGKEKIIVLLKSRGNRE